MNNRDFSNIGEEIRRTVEEAMNSMDYRQLNQRINRTVNMAMDEARRQFGNRPPHVEPPHVMPPQGAGNTVNRRTTAVTGIRIPVKMSGRIMGPVFTIFGGVGSLAGIMLALIALLTSSALGVTKWIAGFIPFALFAVFTIGMLFVFGVGLKKWNRYKDLRKYLRVLEGREFCGIQEISEKTREPKQRIVKKLKKMIQKGMFPEGVLDDQETCLMVTKEAYRLYCQAKEAREQREAEEQERRRRASVPRSAIEEMVDKGDHYIRAIREANDAIPGEAISAKLDRLEMIVRKIFESVKKHPEQMDEMDKFMEYYLPTTEKLVNAYKEFDALPVKGDNVTSSMQEIENTLDTITHAFEQLLDDLFMDTAFDISSDISVLQTMLAREGYKEKDFK